jgi:hypothetical protein
MSSIADLEKELIPDLEINEENMQQKSLMLGKLYYKYLKILTTEKLKQDKREQSRLDQYKILYHNLRSKGFQGFEVSKTKNEIETYMCMDEKYREIEKEISQNQHIIDYLEDVLDQINRVSFNIKNWIDIQRLKLGLV